MGGFTLISAFTTVVDIIIKVHTSICTKIGVTAAIAVITAGTGCRTLGRTIGGRWTNGMTAATVSNGIDLTTRTSRIFVIIAVTGKVTRR